MTSATRNETILIAFGVGVVAWFAPRFPDSLEVGTVVAVAALALLVQGGVRDVVSILRDRRRKTAGHAVSNHPEEMHCMCLESTVGLGGVLLGVLLTALLADGPRIAAPAMLWPVGLAVVGLAGLAIRDLVIQWKPSLKLMRIRDHGSVIVRFR